MPILIKLTIFLQSFLFFAIQPAVAKLLLPKVGGSSQAWIISLLFFQSFLLLGYSLNLAFKRKIKIALIATLLGCIGYYLNSEFRSLSIENNFDLLKFLIFNYGAFSVVLAFSNPLLQKLSSTYSLYSISNTGSLLALLSYPFIVEKYVGLTTQFFIFKISFLIFLGMLVICIFTARQSEEVDDFKIKKLNKNLLSVFFLSLCLNALLVIVTNNLCLHFAEAPFLWILPLVVFLVAFIFGFLEREIIPENILAKITNYSFIILPAFLIFTVKINLPSYLSITLTTYFFISYKIVREIYKLKPEVSKLISFYIYLSAGGVLGTILAGVIAPILFINFYEIVFIFLILFVLLSNKINLSYVFIITAISLLSLINIPYLNTNLIFILYFVSIITVIFFLKKDSKRALLFALLIALSFSYNKSSNSKKLLLSKRNYYGVKEVKSVKNINHFFHGKVVHGIQDLSNPEKVYAYAGKNSGLYDVISEINKIEGIKDVLVIGLGIGNIAAYSADNNYTFIEIDPQVVNIAENRKYFTYLKNCKHCKTITGDGRLETEKLNKNFDLIVLDAFTSGAVPLHLITKEALMIYQSKLKNNGLIIFNISHSYFNILKALSVNAEKLKLKLMYKTSESLSELEYPNKYAVLSNPENKIFNSLKRKKFKAYTPKEKLTHWSDQKSALIDILF